VSAVSVTNASPGTSPCPAVDPDLFFNILNRVLISLGRQNLDSKSPQRGAITVMSTDRVLQILAGPGSGKTEVLVWRVLYEIFVNRRASARLMVTTFTNRAATELQVRIVERCDEFIRFAKIRGLELADPQIHDLRVGTIHSLCDQLLSTYDDAYLEAGTQVIDEAETAIRTARTYRWELGYSSPTARPRLVNRLESCEPLVALFRPPWDDHWPSRTMERVEFIRALVAQHTETWIPRCGHAAVTNGIERAQRVTGLTAELCKLQQRWEQYLDKQSILDFTTIQKRFFDRQQSFIGAFDHIFVDEFQDTNPIQFAIHSGWLKDNDLKLTVVGDDDQAIYRFRGSDIECFRGLEPHCKSRLICYRRETLAVNYRSTRAVVDFAETFKRHTVLRKLSMPKTIVPGPKAEVGCPVRLLTGPWEQLCGVVAGELEGMGAGRPKARGKAAPTAAVLAFSTSEKEYRHRKSAALALRRAIAATGVRVYNPRNKTAGNNESPVAMLLALISYLVDPVSLAPVGAGGRMNEVWASMSDVSKRARARSLSPGFFINDRHAALQKAFLKAHGGRIGAPAQPRRDVVAFVDEIREKLVNLPATTKARLTLSGFVARLLAFPLFRGSGFTLSLFRQALFTQLLEANIAPTRLTKDPLDQPLEVSLHGRKYKWPDRYWNFLNIFGGYLDNTNLDDLEVEAFEEDAVLMVTFHQAKGLEFDHVYVMSTGREPDIGPALRTHLFSGTAVRYTTIGGLQSRDAQINALALGDREREVYVAITRPRLSLTILHDPQLEGQGLYPLNPAIEQVFSKRRSRPHGSDPLVKVREFSHA
jgi:DNA helicase-2/ATP-dependent DNA helicase PcrA